MAKRRRKVAQLDFLDKLIGRAILVSEAFRKEFTDRLVEAIAEVGMRDEARVIAVTRAYLASYNPLFAEHLSNAMILTWLGGYLEQVENLPELVKRWMRDHRFWDQLPPEVPGIFGPGAKSPKAVRFPRIEKATESLFKRGLMTRPQYDRLTAAAKQATFTVAWIDDTAVIGKIRDALAETIAEGPTLDRFREKVVEKLDTSPMGAWHSETVYRTNLMSAYRDGKESLLAHPIVQEVFPFAEYSATHDGRTRDNHLALEIFGIQGTAIYYATDPMWDYFTPPWDYNDRCIKIPMRIADAARAGIEEAKEWLRTGVKPANPTYCLDKIPFRPKPGFGVRHGPLLSVGTASSVRMSAQPIRLAEANPWVPFPGPRGGKRWRNVATGAERYQKERPGAHETGGDASKPHTVAAEHAPSVPPPARQHVAETPEASGERKRHKPRDWSVIANEYTRKDFQTADETKDAPTHLISRDVFAARKVIERHDQVAADMKRHGEWFLRYQQEGDAAYERYKNTADSSEWDTFNAMTEEFNKSRALKAVYNRYVPKLPKKDEYLRSHPDYVYTAMQQAGEELADVGKRRYWSDYAAYELHEQAVKDAVLAGEFVPDDALVSYVHSDWMPPAVREKYLNDETKRTVEKYRQSDEGQALAKLGSNVAAQLQPQKRILANLVALHDVESDPDIVAINTRLSAILDEQGDAVDKRKELRTKFAAAEIFGKEYEKQKQAIRDRVIALCVEESNHANQRQLIIEEKKAAFMAAVAKELAGSGGFNPKLTGLESFQYAEEHKWGIASAVSWLRSVATLNDVEFEIKVKECHDDDGRSKAGGDTLLMQKTAGPAEYVHEIGHVIENRFGLNRLARAFLLHKTRGLPLKHLGAGYKPDEFAVRDELRDDYSGKFYTHNATELVSKGLEEMYRDPISFARDAPEHFLFTMSAINGSLVERAIQEASP